MARIQFQNPELASAFAGTLSCRHTRPLYFGDHPLYTVLFVRYNTIYNHVYTNIDSKGPTTSFNYRDGFTKSQD
jgi:hypothetical protein